MTTTTYIQQNFYYIQPPQSEPIPQNVSLVDTSLLWMALAMAWLACGLLTSVGLIEIGVISQYTGWIIDLGVAIVSLGIMTGLIVNEVMK